MIKTAFSFIEQLTISCYSPNLAKAIADYLTKDIPVYDFGCGPGFYVDFLCKSGFEAYGYEGTEGVERITKNLSIKGGVDITQPMITDKPGHVICLEVIEHIAPEDEDKVLSNLDTFCKDKLILSWALEGQGGHGHLNERNEDYVLPKLSSMGYRFLWEPTETLRSIGGNDLWWFKKSIYVFEKCK